MKDKNGKKVIEFEGLSCKEIELDGKVNLTKEEAFANIEVNIRRGLPQLKGFVPTNEPIVVCAGGPSLNRYVKNIRRRYEAGLKLVSVNGTHGWLLENGMKPSLHVQLDGRPFMSRFVENAVENCAYFVASHSDPSVFDALECHRVYVFHTDYWGSADEVLKPYYRGNFLICHGGSTVTLRAIGLLTILGRRRQEIFGFDSCYLGRRHHAYDQPENDGDLVIPVIPDLVGEGRKRFWCAPWMISQADEFQRMVAHMGDKFELAVYGPGLIAHLLRTGARIQWQPEHGKPTSPRERSSGREPSISPQASFT